MAMGMMGGAGSIASFMQKSSAVRAQNIANRAARERGGRSITEAFMATTAQRQSRLMETSEAYGQKMVKMEQQRNEVTASMQAVRGEKALGPSNAGLVQAFAAAQGVAAAAAMRQVGVLEEGKYYKEVGVASIAAQERAYVLHSQTKEMEPPSMWELLINTATAFGSNFAAAKMAKLGEGWGFDPDKALGGDFTGFQVPGGYTGPHGGIF